MKLGTERIAAILARFGNPEAGLRGALVAGTNGKGSTAAMMASILEAAGLSTGLMPKPHLVSYTERIQVNSQPIPEAEFAHAIGEIRAQLDEVAARFGDPTEFEILTAVALTYLAPRIDRLVCEVGMGGRLDATNVLDLGVAVITNVSLDHQQHLGSTVEAIAAEKAAIIKRGNTVITGCEGGPLEVVERQAHAMDARLSRLGQEIRLESRSLGWDGSEISVAGPGFRHSKLTVPLVGDFQAANAALAVAAAHATAEVTDGEVRDGLRATTWPGRLEVVATSPRVVLDGGHNVDGLTRSGESLRRLIGDDRLVVVFGVMADKDLPGMLAALRRLKPDAVVFTAVAEPRAARPEQLAELWGTDDGSTVDEPEAALGTALDRAGKDGTVLVCGSLYLVGALRPKLLTVAA